MSFHRFILFTPIGVDIKSVQGDDYIILTVREPFVRIDMPLWENTIIVELQPSQHST